CNQCGECCTYMGTVRAVQDNLGGPAFLLLNRYTGERTAVTVDPDRMELYADRSTPKRCPETCPSLRYSPGDGEVYCSVHATRPVYAGNSAAGVS
ncbi:MAG: hypothetical protein KO206_00415, partial [Methanomicrobiaceae archaeon]|nr:hypothetical protein [Methanomicrobiaceae archaeon]